MTKPLVLKTTIEVLVKMDEEDTEWFREQEGKDQAAALTRSAGLLQQAVSNAIGSTEHTIKIDVMEVPEWE